MVINKRKINEDKFLYFNVNEQTISLRNVKKEKEEEEKGSPLNEFKNCRCRTAWKVHCIRFKLYLLIHHQISIQISPSFILSSSSSPSINQKQSLPV